MNTSHSMPSVGDSLVSARGTYTVSCDNTHRILVPINPPKNLPATRTFVLVTDLTTLFDLERREMRPFNFSGILRPRAAPDSPA